MYNICEKILATIPPAAAAKLVVTKTKEVVAGSAESTEPPLKPNQPNQRISTPPAASGMLCPNIGFDVPSALNFPIRAPKK